MSTSGGFDPSPWITANAALAARLGVVRRHGLGLSPLGLAGIGSVRGEAGFSGRTITGDQDEERRRRLKSIAARPGRGSGTGGALTGARLGADPRFGAADQRAPFAATSTAALLARGYQPAVIKVISYAHGATRATASAQYVERDEVELETHDGLRLADRQAVAEEIKAVQPQMSFLAAIREALPEDGILRDDMTQVGYVSWYGMPFHHPRTGISSGFSGNLGAGFPTALGIKVAHPDKAVVAVCGDGGFLFGGADLATAVRYGINLVTVVFNNESYGNVLRDQRRLFDGRHSGAELTNPDFQTFAKSFGVRSWRVRDGEGLRGAVREALAANAPCLIEVMTDITRETSPFSFISPTRS